MSNQRFTPEFKDEAVRKVVERGYSVAEVADRVGVSAHSLYKWVKAVRQCARFLIPEEDAKAEIDNMERTVRDRWYEIARDE
jgi:transposase